MKKWSLLVMLLLCFALPFFYAGASGAPKRSATEVDDVLEADFYDEWIVSPDEEPTDDQNVNNAPECDIYGVTACYDNDYLRVDILLNNEISFYLDTFYSIKFEYESLNEYYTYNVDTDELVYAIEKNGKITERRILTESNSDDYAGVADSFDLDDSVVYFIINKRDHFRGKKGMSYYLNCTFFSGFVSESDEVETADETIEVDMTYVF